MHWSTGMTTSADAVCLTELLLSNYHRCSDRSTTFGFWLFRIWEYEPQIDELRPFRKKWAPKLPGNPDLGSLAALSGPLSPNSDDAWDADKTCRVTIAYPIMRAETGMVN